MTISPYHEDNFQIDLHYTCTSTTRSYDIVEYHIFITPISIELIKIVLLIVYITCINYHHRFANLA